MLTRRSDYNNYNHGHYHRFCRDGHVQHHHHHNFFNHRDGYVLRSLEQAKSVDKANLWPLTDTVTVSQTETDTFTLTAATTTSTVAIPNGFIFPTPTAGGKKRGLSPAVQANAMMKRFSETLEARTAPVMPARCKGAKIKYPYKVACTQIFESIRPITFTVTAMRTTTVTAPAPTLTVTASVTTTTTIYIPDASTTSTSSETDTVTSTVSVTQTQSQTLVPLTSSCTSDGN